MNADVPLPARRSMNTIAGKPGEVDLAGVRAEVDVVAEQGRGLVPVHRAPDVREDAHVVERRELVAVQAEPVAEPQCR